MIKEGILNINKPKDWTSQDVCAKLRSMLKIKKIGHTGTLDPMATGVLPICLGKATRIIEYYDKDYKTYRVRIKLGIETDTYDITGNIINSCKISDLSEKSIREVICSFEGKISQIPPKYSALRVNGKRAYDLAREGKDFELKSRKVIIQSIDILDIDIENYEVSFEVVCSKGTYIRSLTHDIGKKLGCGATMIELERTKSGVFDINKSITLAKLLEKTDSEINEIVIPMEETLELLGKIDIKEDINKYLNGMSIDDTKYLIIEKSNFDNLYKIFENEKFIGIGSLTDKILKPEKVIIGENY